MPEVNSYIDNIEEKWQGSFIKLKEVIDKNIPSGFELRMEPGMPTYVVPLATYPDGYLGKKDTPLPFISIAAQKKHLAVYHMGVYADEALLDWFEQEYPNHMDTKLNMGKSCIRFTNPKKIPYELMGELVSKLTVNDWIKLYENEKK